MHWDWKKLAPHAIRISKKVFFFYKSSHSVNLPSDPVRQMIHYRHPLARVVVGCLPYRLKKPFLKLYVTERIVEYPFVWRHLDVSPGATILDLGATGSKLALELANYSYQVIAVDVQDYPFTHPNLRSWRGNFLANSFPPASVDAVVAISTIEHLGIPYYGGPSEPDADLRTMQEIWRLLKPAGRLLLTVPYGQAAQTSHQRVYDASRLKTLLERFKIEQMNFYRREKGCHWLPAEEATMRTVSSVPRTEGIALVRACKP
ncbi:MAG: class I SAM-dependent methyltransferase [Terriglobia bacterium]